MIHVLNPGLLTSIQDLGRIGYQQYGVIVSGAMDPVALRIGNVLVGNPANSAGLEMTMLGPRLEFTEDALIAVTGQGLAPSINGMEVPAWRQVFVQAGTILEFRPLQSGCRSYLAVAGGIDVPVVMGSRSTYLRAGIGGFQGRALKAGDLLRTGRKSEFGQESMLRLATEDVCRYSEWFPSHDVLPGYRKDPVLRVIAGSQMKLFSPKSLSEFESNWFQLSSQSDRMGYRLHGPQLQTIEPVELISEAVTVGTIQVPPDGNPIVLMADRQTTGGYPKIAQIVSVDISVMAQLRPGGFVRFKFISLEHASELLREQERQLQSFEQGLQVIRMR